MLFKIFLNKRNKNNKCTKILEKIGSRGTRNLSNLASLAYGFEKWKDSKHKLRCSLKFLATNQLLNNWGHFFVGTPCIETITNGNSKWKWTTINYNHPDFGSVIYIQLLVIVTIFFEALVLDFWPQHTIFKFSEENKFNAHKLITNFHYQWAPSIAMISFSVARTRYRTNLIITNSYMRSFTPKQRSNEVYEVPVYHLEQKIMQRRFILMKCKSKSTTSNLVESNWTWQVYWTTFRIFIW